MGNKAGDKRTSRGLTRRRFLASVAVSSAFPACRAAVFKASDGGGSPPERTASASRPSFLLVVADDLGREWLGCYGGRSSLTPNIDALARGGVRFASCYATPLCTPSRVELLTGRYGFRTRWTTHHDTPRWGGKFFDWRKEICFARILRDHGYATAIAGKWQVNDFDVQPDALERHGFDEHCVWIGGPTKRYWNPQFQVNGRRPDLSGEFGPDVCCEFLGDFIRRNKDQPFLAYYPMLLTHAPFVQTPGGGPAGRPDGRASAARKDARARIDLYAAMVAYGDLLIGRLVRLLEELQIRRNTIVIFTSDNGSPRSVWCNAWGRKVRGGKGTLHETGICVPLVVNCPGQVVAGRVAEGLVDFSDFLPTMVELARVSLPPGIQSDGCSFAKLLADKAGGPSRRWIFSQLGEKRVVRDRRFKLYSDGRMYDLLVDSFEENDLSGSQEADAKEAARRLGRILKELGSEGKI